MKLEETEKLVYLVIIAGRKQKDGLLSALSEFGVPFTNALYGQGTVKASYVEDMLGLVHEKKKVIITSVMPAIKAGLLLGMLIARFGFNKPNTGIAFTMPVDRLMF